MTGVEKLSLRGSATRTSRRKISPSSKSSSKYSVSRRTPNARDAEKKRTSAGKGSRERERFTSNRPYRRPGLRHGHLTASRKYDLHRRNYKFQPSMTMQGRRSVPKITDNDEKAQKSEHDNVMLGWKAMLAVQFAPDEWWNDPHEHQIVLSQAWQAFLQNYLGPVAYADFLELKDLAAYSTHSRFIRYMMGLAKTDLAKKGLWVPTKYRYARTSVSFSFRCQICQVGYSTLDKLGSHVMNHRSGVYNHFYTLPHLEPDEKRNEVVQELIDEMTLLIADLMPYSPRDFIIKDGLAGDFSEVSEDDDEAYRLSVDEISDDGIFDGADKNSDSPVTPNCTADVADNLKLPAADAEEVVPKSKEATTPVLRHSSSKKRELTERDDLRNASGKG